MRIGLFGGTFNPIHNCHLIIAAQTRDRLGLDRLVFIPSGDPPHKASDTLAPARHRIEMVRRGIADDPSFSVSDVEVRRATKSYSFETVHTFRTEYGAEAELFFIVGLDAFLEFPTWKQASELLDSCQFVVVSRQGHSFASLAGFPLLPTIAPNSLEALDSRDRDWLDIPLRGGKMIIFLGLPPCPASASEIRSRFKSGLGAAVLLPAPVESYIIQLGLYQEGPDRTSVEG